MSKRITDKLSYICRQIFRVKRYIKGVLVTTIWRARGVKIPDRVLIEGPTPHIWRRGQLILGSRVSFRTISTKSRLAVNNMASLIIHDRCFFNSNCVLDCSVSISIGTRSMIGDDVQIRDSNYHEVDEGGGVFCAPIQIGKNVWIGNGSKILPGVEIGDHSVVGAGSVVTKSVPSGVVVAGNPARVIRKIKASEGYFRP